jgi:hypothetical protein
LHFATNTRAIGKFSIGSTVANAGMYDYVLATVGSNGLSIGRTHMPKFLRIGVHQSNVSGYTSKAWWVRRVGSTVFLKWGAVEVHGVGDGRKIYWTLAPQAKTIRCGTVQRAKDYAKAAIVRRRNHRYEPLAGNIAIRRRPADRGDELEQALATILFVDIVRSTEKAARLGDSRWTQVMNHYYAAVRRELKTLRGKEVVTTGRRTARDVRRAGCRGPLRDRNSRGSAHAGAGDQGGAARGRIQSERG